MTLLKSALPPSFFVIPFVTFFLLLFSLSLSVFVSVSFSVHLSCCLSLSVSVSLSLCLYLPSGGGSPSLSRSCHGRHCSRPRPVSSPSALPHDHLSYSLLPACDVGCVAKGIPHRSCPRLYCEKLAWRKLIYWWECVRERGREERKRLEERKGEERSKRERKGEGRYKWKATDLFAVVK